MVRGVIRRSNRRRATSAVSGEYVDLKQCDFQEFNIGAILVPLRAMIMFSRRRIEDAKWVLSGRAHRS